MRNLTKENLWTPLEEKYPEAMKQFKKWIDEYKNRNNFTELFNQGVCSHTITPKYHDLPDAIQIGIFLEFAKDHACGFALPDMYLVTWEEWIKAAIAYLQDHINETNKVYKEMADEERETQEHNTKILTEIGGTVFEDFEHLIEDVRLSGRLEIVSEPTGDPQDEECGIFKDIHVDQSSVGDSGDSYEGFIYGKFDEGKWLKVPYYC